jgi:hypothetical protein
MAADEKPNHYDASRILDQAVLIVHEIQVHVWPARKGVGVGTSVQMAPLPAGG